MNDLSHTMGRDPVMDRAVARVAQSLDDFERTLGTDVERAEQLAVSARRLWGATARLETDAAPTAFRELRSSIQDFVVDCKEATHALHLDATVEIQQLYAVFSHVVRSYRTFILTEQAVRFAENYSEIAANGGRS